MSTALWAKIQAFVGVTSDGIPGNNTAEAIARKLGIDKAEPGPTLSDPVTIDVRSAANIATLRPDAQQKAREWLLKCLEAGINVKVICGTRTYKEQDALYAQGRSTPGPKVTNAPADRTVVQVKLYSQPVGNSAVQEAIAAKTYFRCHHAMVITNNTFTASARELATRASVQLVERNGLIKMIDAFNRSPKDYHRLRVLMTPKDDMNERY